MYGEETDLCRRARREGARPRMTPEATHRPLRRRLVGARVDREILILKARATLARRYLPAWQRPLGIGLLLAWPLSRAARRPG